jgi:hypothetical protein
VNHTSALSSAVLPWGSGESCAPHTPPTNPNPDVPFTVPAPNSTLVLLNPASYAQIGDEALPVGYINIQR